MNSKWKRALIIIAANVILLAMMCGCILYTLTYKEVPIQEQHLWYGDTLAHYLWWNHLETTLGYLFIFCPLVNILFFEFNPLKIIKKH